MNYLKTPLVWLMAALANLLGFRRDDDAALETYKFDDTDEFDRYHFTHIDADLLSVVGNVESVSDLGYDPVEGTIVAIVAKPDVDTAQIDARLPDGVYPILTIRPTTNGVAAITAYKLDELQADSRFLLAMQKLIASGFVPGEAFNGRHNVKVTDIKSGLVNYAADIKAAGDKIKGIFSMLKFEGLVVRFVVFAYGRMLVITDAGVTSTIRMNAATFTKILASGVIPTEYAKLGTTVTFKAQPLTILGNGANTIVGLVNKMNVAIKTQPSGKITVVTDPNAYGSLVSLFADIAEQKTDTAIAMKDDGTTTRVPFAVMSERFRQTAGIAFSNGKPAQETAQG